MRLFFLHFIFDPFLDIRFQIVVIVEVPQPKVQVLLGHHLFGDFVEKGAPCGDKLVDCLASASDLDVVMLVREACLLGLVVDQVLVEGLRADPVEYGGVAVLTQQQSENLFRCQVDLLLRVLREVVGIAPVNDIEGEIISFTDNKPVVSNFALEDGEYTYVAVGQSRPIDFLLNK